MQANFFFTNLATFLVGSVVSYTHWQQYHLNGEGTEATDAFLLSRLIFILILYDNECKFPLHRISITINYFGLLSIHSISICRISNTRLLANVAKYMYVLLCQNGNNNLWRILDVNWTVLFDVLWIQTRNINTHFKKKT